MTADFDVQRRLPDGDVKIWCTNCGRTLDSESTADHPQTCRPRWSYWWPRQHPFLLALAALAVGLLLGLIL